MIEQKTRNDSVGFIGLGMMGQHMARNIARRGFPLAVYDVNSSATVPFRGESVLIGDNPMDVAANARIVVLMVDTTEQVDDVIFGESGLVKGAISGDIIICMSTISPVSVRLFAARLNEFGVSIIDSPVAGMEKGAREGNLRAYIGGEADDVEACRAVLEAMAGTIVHIGPLGQGLAMKLVNNMMCQVGWVVAAEALVMGAKAGLDPKMMIDLIGRATGNSVALEYLGPRWLDRNFDGIRLDITFKDMQHEIDLGKSVGTPMVMASLAQQMYEMARCKGLGSEDGVAVIKVYEAMAGISSEWRDD